MKIVGKILIVVVIILVLSYLFLAYQQKTFNVKIDEPGIVREVADSNLYQNSVYFYQFNYPKEANLTYLDRRGGAIIGTLKFPDAQTTNTLLVGDEKGEMFLTVNTALTTGIHEYDSYSILNNYKPGDEEIYLPAESITQNGIVFTKYKVRKNAQIKSGVYNGNSVIYTTTHSSIFYLIGLDETNKLSKEIFSTFKFIEQNNQTQNTYNTHNTQVSTQQTPSSDVVREIKCPDASSFSNVNWQPITGQISFNCVVDDQRTIVLSANAKHDKNYNIYLTKQGENNRLDQFTLGSGPIYDAQGKFQYYDARVTGNIIDLSYPYGAVSGEINGWVFNTSNSSVSSYKLLK